MMTCPHTLVLLGVVGASLTVAPVPASASASSPMSDSQLQVFPWGRDSFRVIVPIPGGMVQRSWPSALLQPIPEVAATPDHPRPQPATASTPTPTPAVTPTTKTTTSWTNGNLRLDLLHNGVLQFVRVADNRVILTEQSHRFLPTHHQQHSPLPPTLALDIEFDFGATNTALYGLGQNRQTCYKEGGRQTPSLSRIVAPNESFTYTLAAGEGGAANTLPWTMGAAMGEGANVGVWMNMPGTGNVTFDARANSTTTAAWRFTSVMQLDYVVTTNTNATTVATQSFSILENFVKWCGASPGLPEWALGYWHSKNRYASQDELLEAARGFANRSIPVDIIVIDWLHWKVQGDWHFDSEAWPDPSAMVTELKELGMEVMVTVWPFSYNGSLSFNTLNDNGWITRKISQPDEPVYLDDSLHGALIDVTNPAARKYVWSMINDGYYKHGIRVFWLDAAEPEYFEMPAWGKLAGQDAQWGDGEFDTIGQMFTHYWVQTFHDGLQENGEKDTVMLPRSSYAGSQQFGAGLWSGDIHCSFDVLKSQVQTGLSAQISGFGLWTTDIGGYSAPPNGNCDATNSSYRELVTRWFQFGATCPIFRQHGQRETEIWLYGEIAEINIASVIWWRTTKKTYLQQEMRKLNETGRPINRPLWFDFGQDVQVWGIDDEYMFGDDYLVAPVLQMGQRQRKVYLPCTPDKNNSTCQWTHEFTHQVYTGPAWHVIYAPLSNFPVFRRGESSKDIF